MEYVGGGNLSEYMAKYEKGIEMKKVKHFMKQILRGIEHLHTYKIMHRDLKVIFISFNQPANILLNEDENICKLADFGISTEVECEVI
jgi:serine/threonine protein kinase